MKRTTRQRNNERNYLKMKCVLMKVGEVEHARHTQARDAWNRQLLLKLVI